MDVEDTEVDITVDDDGDLEVDVEDTEVDITVDDDGDLEVDVEDTRWISLRMR